MSKAAPVSDVASTATPPSSTPLLAPDEAKAKIEADVAVVNNLKELENLFGHTLVQVKRLFKVTG